MLPLPPADGGAFWRVIASCPPSLQGAALVLGPRNLEAHYTARRGPNASLPGGQGLYAVIPKARSMACLRALSQ